VPNQPAASPGVPTASPSTTCPKCGSPMVLRTARRGSQPGQRFLGCSRYPQCR
jgi:ssDNA-binding Zn-finger/Zn-ribbon topoisomerase 1